MDLSSILSNDGPAPEKRPSQSTPRSSTASLPAQASSAINGQSASYHPSPHGQQTPQHGLPSARQSVGLTPLQTPTQAPAGGSYPFPQHLSQSPAGSYPIQQYPPFGPHSATTPASRPQSHGYQQPSPGRYPPPSASYGMPSQQMPSLSPTPSSHHSANTPHSFRQSPHSAMQQQPPPSQLLHQLSQPGTPLGPPPNPHQRTSYQGVPDLQSPYHQRTMSAASNGVASGSPAHHNPSIGNLLDSPNSYNRHSPQMRRTSDYLARMDRERSVSVSPRTKVFPRPPSLGSRQSSQEQAQSARSSVQHNAGIVGSPTASIPGHVIPPNPSAVAAPQPPHLYSQGSGEVSQSSKQTPLGSLAQPTSADSLSQFDNQPAPPLQHQPQKMDMNHLLTPATSVTGMDGINEAAQQPVQRMKRDQQPNIFMKPSPKPKKPAVAPPPSQTQPDARDRSTAADLHDAPEQARPIETPLVGADSQSGAPVVKSEPMNESKKRPAESEPETAAEPPAKRGKTRKYQDRPMWARLARSNPNYKEGINGTGRAPRPNGAHPVSEQQPQTLLQGSHDQTSQVAGLQPPSRLNGHAQTNGQLAKEPWEQDPPLDGDLIRARQLFGQWEKSVMWSTPFPDIEMAVGDWLFLQFSALQDVGNDPLEGTIEVEAKIGRIMTKTTDERIKFPVQSMTVLAADWARENVRFESQMEHDLHQGANVLLNRAIQDSKFKRGRAPMDYQHPKETDSFQSLSPAGIQALPTSIQKRLPKNGRELRLRTSRDTRTGEVKARIVKIPVADLHIYNPRGDYDCRISINIEANLNRPDLHPADLVDLSKLAAPERKKDRLSYKHLCYSIDLTRVDVDGLPHKYELELEVDSKVLREQMARLGGEDGGGFGYVVSGFLDNATLLMRLKPPAPQQ